MAPPELNRVVGQVLREIRNEAKIPQDELADRAGLHRTSVGLLENGKRGITLAVLVRWCAACGVSLTAVAGRIEKRMAGNKRSTELRR